MKEGSIPLRERQTLAEQWTSFEKAVILPHAGGMERRAMKMAFYGGAFAYFTLAISNLDEGDDETELDIAYLASLEQEMRDFTDTMRRAS